MPRKHATRSLLILTLVSKAVKSNWNYLLENKSKSFSCNWLNLVVANPRCEHPFPKVMSVIHSVISKYFSYIRTILLWLCVTWNIQGKLVNDQEQSQRALYTLELEGTKNCRIAFSFSTLKWKCSQIWKIGGFNQKLCQLSLENCQII